MKLLRFGAAGAEKPGLLDKDGTIRDLSVEGRMTVCNLTIEAGARAGMIAPDEKTFAYFKGRPMAPKGENWEKAVAYWKTLPSDEGAKFDKEVNVDIANLPPMITWGTSPQQVVAIDGAVPAPGSCSGSSSSVAGVSPVP